MSDTTRLVVAALLRLSLLGFGMWIAFAPSALPEGTPVVTRAALTMLFVVVALLFGDMVQLKDQFALLQKLLKATGGGPGKRDDREAIDLLIRGLSAPDADTREKAHHHLKRLTRQDMPARPELWQAWWAANRDAYLPPDKGVSA
ncbi:MAG: hypothetical protein ACKOCB_06260 [Planctomycetia bacterium]